LHWKASKTGGQVVVHSSAWTARGLLAEVDPSVLQRLRRRVMQETEWEMRRHPSERRLRMYAIFLMAREAEIADGLVDLLLERIANRHAIIKQLERPASAAASRSSIPTSRPSPSTRSRPGSARTRLNWRRDRQVARGGAGERDDSQRRVLLARPSATYAGQCKRFVRARR
jgi:hypothetical protein